MCKVALWFFFAITIFTDKLKSSPGTLVLYHYQISKWGCHYVSSARLYLYLFISSLSTYSTDLWMDRLYLNRRYRRKIVSKFASSGESYKGHDFCVPEWPRVTYQCMSPIEERGLWWLRIQFDKPAANPNQLFPPPPKFYTYNLIKYLFLFVCIINSIMNTSLNALEIFDTNRLNIWLQLQEFLKYEEKHRQIHY